MSDESQVMPSLETQSPLQTPGLFTQCWPVVLSVVLSFVVLWPTLGAGLKPDGFAYWLLAESFFTDKPYHVWAVRDFYVPTDLPVPSRSFPPLYPLMLAGWHAIFQSGMYSGIYVNLIGVVVLVAVNAAFARALTGKGWSLCSNASLILVLADPYFREEIAAGTAYPWHYALLLASLWSASSLIVRPDSKSRAVLTGVLLGLLALLRFDQTLWAIGAIGLIGLGIIWRTRSLKQSLRPTALTAIVTAAVLSPWMIRNQVVFNTPFASDNAITAKSIESVTVIASAFENNKPTLYSDNPGRWFQLKFKFLRNNLHDWFQYYPICILAACVTLYLVMANRDRLPLVTKCFVAMALCQITLVLLSLSLTPYNHERYFSPFCFVYLVLMLLLIDQLTSSEVVRDRWAKLVYVTLLGFLVVCVAWPDYDKCLKSRGYRRAILPLRENERTRFYDEIVTKMTLNTERKIHRMVAVQMEANSKIDAEAFTSITGIPTIFLPFNIQADSPAFRYWLNHWKPDYLIVYEDWLIRMGLVQHARYAFPVPKVGHQLVLVTTESLLDK